MNQEEHTSGQGAPAILVAEDHPDSRDALRMLLEAYGYRVLLAADGRQAVECALASRPDLILMDLMMPEIDGMEATRQLRTRPAFQGVPIVALTALESGRERAIAMGFDDFITKPIDLPVFFGKLRGWLEKGRSATA